ncbi:hypothetical protein TCEA9_18560 [Thermobrachium celere]|nr:hypothetical protein TCEA9_18560 [Thermobrachium celere]
MDNIVNNIEIMIVLIIKKVNVICKNITSSFKVEFIFKYKKYFLYKNDDKKIEIVIFEKLNKVLKKGTLNR